MASLFILRIVDILHGGVADTDFNRLSWLCQRCLLGFTTATIPHSILLLNPADEVKVSKVA